MALRRANAMGDYTGETVAWIWPCAPVFAPTAMAAAPPAMDEEPPLKKAVFRALRHLQTAPGARIYLPEFGINNRPTQTQSLTR
jgi:hypothetical protein